MMDGWMDGRMDGCAVDVLLKHTLMFCCWYCTVGVWLWILGCSGVMQLTWLCSKVYCTFDAELLLMLYCWYFVVDDRLLWCCAVAVMMLMVFCWYNFDVMLCAVMGCYCTVDVELLLLMLCCWYCVVDNILLWCYAAAVMLFCWYNFDVMLWK